MSIEHNSEERVRMLTESLSETRAVWTAGGSPSDLARVAALVGQLEWVSAERLSDAGALGTVAEARAALLDRRQALESAIDATVDLGELLDRTRKCVAASTASPTEWASLFVEVVALLPRVREERSLQFFEGLDEAVAVVLDSAAVASRLGAAVRSLQCDDDWLDRQSVEQSELIGALVDGAGPPASGGIDYAAVLDAAFRSAGPELVDEAERRFLGAKRKQLGDVVVSLRRFRERRGPAEGGELRLVAGEAVAELSPAPLMERLAGNDEAWAAFLQAEDQGVVVALYGLPTGSVVDLVGPSGPVLGAWTDGRWAAPADLAGLWKLRVDGVEVSFRLDDA